jgi:hypothetical protein
MNEHHGVAYCLYAMIFNFILLSSNYYDDYPRVPTKSGKQSRSIRMLGR